MKTRFYLALSKDVPTATRQLLRVGLPEQKYMIPNICLCQEGSYENIALNAYALREALLRDAETTKLLLGIEVKDATIVKAEEKKPTKKQTVKEEEKAQ